MLNMHYHHAFYWKIYIFWHNIHSKSKISFKNTWVVRILRFGFGQDDMDCIQLHIIWTILDSISLLYTWLNAWIRNYLWQLYDSNKTNHSDLLTLHWKWKIHVFITLLISQFTCDLKSFFESFPALWAQKNEIIIKKEIISTVLQRIFYRHRLI